MGEIKESEANCFVCHVIFCYILVVIVYLGLGLTTSIVQWDYLCEDNNNFFIRLSVWLLIKTIFGVILIFILPLFYIIINKIVKTDCGKIILTVYTCIYVILYVIFIIVWGYFGFVLLFREYYECSDELVWIVSLIYLILSLIAIPIIIIIWKVIK